MLTAFQILLFGCAKPDDLDIAYSTISLPTSAVIRDVTKTPTGFVFVGGDVKGKGFVIETDNNLSNTKLVKGDFDFPLYCVAFTGGQYIFGSDEAQIIYSDSLTQFDYHFFQEVNWVNDQYKLPLRQILIDSTKWIMSGGGDFQFGYTYVSSDSGSSWQPSEFANEVHAISLAQGGDVAAVGNGIVVTSQDGLNWKRQRLDHVLLTGAAGSLTCAFTGEFYRAHSSYSEFTKLSVEGNPRYLTRLVEIDHPTFTHVSVGKQGNVAWVHKNGSISGGVLIEDVDFTDAIEWSNEQILLTADNGKIYLVDFP